MAPRTSTFVLVDRILDGKLAEFLTEGAARGESLTDLAFRLRSEYDIKVTGETIRRWLRDVEESRAQAAADPIEAA